MIKKTNIDLSISPKRKNPLAIGVQLSSYDKNFHEFEISFLEKELKGSDAVDILTVFESSKRTSESTTEIKGGYALFSFDTSLIDRDEVVTNYVYLKSGDSQAEIGAFKFDVKLSEIDKGTKVIAEAYDESYESLIQDFEKELRDYLRNLETIDQEEGSRKDAEAVRKSAEADRVASEDTRESAESQRELNEEERISNEQARELNEEERISNEQARELNEEERISNEQARELNEEERISNEQARELNEEERISNEQARELNEEERISKDSERDSKIEAVVDAVEDVSGKLELKANKKQADWIFPTLLNGVEDTPAQPIRFMKDEFGFVHINGRVTNAVLRSAIFTLPQGYRPEFNLSMVGNGGGGTHVMFSIGTTGNVSPLSGNLTYITLDGISFYVGGD